MLTSLGMSSRRAAAACALLVTCCGGSSGETPSTGKPIGGEGESHFAGTYEVPVEPALKPAATFPLSSVEWRVSDGKASLSYELPKELVGKSIELDFSGPVTGAEAALRGEAGTADCAIGETEVTCQENLRGLSPIEPDLTKVATLAQASYPGSPQDRVDVAAAFGTDPIGIAHIDLLSKR